MNHTTQDADAGAGERLPLAYVSITPSSIALNSTFWAAFEAVAPADKAARGYLWREVIEVVDKHVELEKGLLQAQCRILHDELTELRERFDDLQRTQCNSLVKSEPAVASLPVEEESPMSQLERRFSEQGPARQTFQNRVHQYFVERIGGAETMDATGSSRRLLRAAMLLANEAGIPVASMVEVWRSLPARKTDRLKTLGECFIALNGLASSIKYDLAEVGDKQLGTLISTRELPLNYSASDLFFIPF